MICLQCVVWGFVSHRAVYDGMFCGLALCGGNFTILGAEK